MIERKIINHPHNYSEEQPYLRGYIAALGYRQVRADYDRAERKRWGNSISLGQMVNLALMASSTVRLFPCGWQV